MHGGILALLVDDVLGFSYEALGNVKMAVTANLNVDYRQPVPADTTISIQTFLVERTKRKLVWKAKVVDAYDDSLIYCEVSSVFVIPREHSGDEDNHQGERAA